MLLVSKVTPVCFAVQLPCLIPVPFFFLIYWRGQRGVYFNYNLDIKSLGTFNISIFFLLPFVFLVMTLKPFTISSLLLSVSPGIMNLK